MIVGRYRGCCVVLLVIVGRYRGCCVMLLMIVVRYRGRLSRDVGDR